MASVPVTPASAARLKVPSSPTRWMMPAERVIDVRAARRNSAPLLRLRRPTPAGGAGHHDRRCTDEDGNGRSVGRARPRGRGGGAGARAGGRGPGGGGGARGG